ncbi:MAG: hypothetical protein A3E37_03545 [Candidatus Andersenbacteria bacterium RIFCSPHIGHO2_12_FULL_46_9]|nr:MAG: Xanthosine triphosphate pyrophosphatase [Parcubacteria group bacterium GW2011_GWA2_45_14]OGY34096.1 MAG: hypothetical protein A3B76_04375 [Candidatus Andersenbacteria bacterium RIFCSPHIGHO2_02_FULL_46_16]OGY35328.1 MAG: hypothetical protein A3E37_03545 [Candidatus Andersenbacteria bacterium RIFCSPHIGHO2_12_FULL_46_9]OGY36074.1 MAG: hypothetical protein A3I08_03505 [Candidatus Andersenbacteria bacterium RIFCSPLOWO2_02_FULL_46_11]HBE90013.1 non-canonical purine NTP pyrophosphatase [Candid
MIVNFVTTNKHKFEEAKLALSQYHIETVQVNMKYEENHDESMTDIVKQAARRMAEEIEQTVVVEDTGLFFTAWPGFPGALPKFVWQTIGYKGIFKLLEGTDRGAYFKTVLGRCQPGEEPKLFAAVMRGEITKKVYDKNRKVMPYDRIFIPAGEKVTISDMTMEKKNSFSQRGKVFRKLGRWLVSQKMAN